MVDRLPILVGVGQLSHRIDDLADAREPLLLMEDAARIALADVHAVGFADHLDSVRVVNMISASYADPAGALAERLGLPVGERLYTTMGGNTPQWLVNRTADDLAAGSIRGALLAGGEALHALRLAAKRSVALPWGRGGRRSSMIGDDRQGSHPDEWKHGAQMPTQIYPLFEVALRAHEGLAPAAHLRHIATLAASLSRVAADNPHAWFRTNRTAAEIGSVSASNRMVAFPYPKLMNAIIEVDQAAAVVMTTVAEARACGIPPERWVYLHGAGDAHDLWWVRDRVDFHSSPGMALAFEEALAQAGITPSALDPVDVYSCFPAAVQFAAAILGFPSDGSRSLTVTGGLPYFGGPGNNYTMHAIATMVERLRAEPNALGLVSGLGWYMTKHAVGIYGVAPPARAWSRPDHAQQQARIDALAHPECIASATGRARIETYTVLHERDGSPTDAVVIARLESGARAFANVDPDPDFFAALEREEMVGATGYLRPGLDGRNRFYPLGG